MRKIMILFLALTVSISLFEMRAFASTRVKPYRPEEDNLVNLQSQIYSVTEPPLFKHRLTWNIESINYYVDDSASKYTNPIEKAANNWVYTGYGYNRLYPFTQTTNKQMSAADFTTYNSNDGINAITYHYIPCIEYIDFGRPVDPQVEDWTYCEIELNTYNMDTFAFNTRQGVIAHEMGHLFGLMHNDLNSYSIMCQYATGRQVYTVQQVDVNSFLKRYPN